MVTGKKNVKKAIFRKKSQFWENEPEGVLRFFKVFSELDHETFLIFCQKLYSQNIS